MENLRGGEDLGDEEELADLNVHEPQPENLHRSDSLSEEFNAYVEAEKKDVAARLRAFDNKQAVGAGGGHIEDDAGDFFWSHVENDARFIKNLRKYEQIITNIIQNPRNVKKQKNRFYDLYKLQKLVEKVLETYNHADELDSENIQDLRIIPYLQPHVLRFLTNSNTDAKSLKARFERLLTVTENPLPVQEAGGKKFRFSQRGIKHQGELAMASPSERETMLSKWLALFSLDAFAKNLPSPRDKFHETGNTFGIVSALLGDFVGQDPASISPHIFLDFVKRRKGFTWSLRKIGCLLCRNSRGGLLVTDFAKWTAAILFVNPEKNFDAKLPEEYRVWLKNMLHRPRDEANNQGPGPKRPLSPEPEASPQPNKTQRTDRDMTQTPRETLAQPPMAPFASADEPHAKPRVRGVSSAFVKLLGRFIASNTLDKLDAFQVADLLAEKMDRGVDDEEGGFAGLESFLGSEHGAAMRDVLFGLAEDSAEKDTNPWFDKATHFVCYHPDRPFQTVIDSLADNSQPRVYWWIDLVSNARPRGQNESTRVDSFVAIRSTQSFAMVIDDWQNPSVVSRESCRAEIAVAVDEGRTLRAVMPKAIQEDLIAFSNNVMHSEQDEAPEDDHRDGQAEFDKLSHALVDQGKSLEASNNYSAQIYLKTRLAIIEVILKPTKDLIRQHRGPGNLTPQLNFIERSLDVVDATNAFVALAPAFTIQGRLAEGISMLKRISKKVSKELYGTPKPSLARCADLKNVLGRALFSMGRLYCDTFSGDRAVACAELCCDAAIAILEACGDPLCARAQYVLARTLVNCHMTITSFSARDKAADIEKATKMLDAAISTMERDEALQADLGALYVHRAKLSDLSGKPASVVEEDFERAIGVQVDLYGPCDPRLNLTSKCRGQSWYWRGNVAKAVFHWTQAFSHIFDGFAANSVPAYHVFKILSFSWIGFAKLREERSEMSFQEKDFVACTVEPYFVTNRKRLFEELEGYYPGEAVQCDEIGFDWIATSLRRILVVVKDTCLEKAIKDELFADYQVDLVRTVEGAKEKLAEHIYAAVLVASDSVAASALAAHPTILDTEGSSARPHSKLIRFSDEEVDDDGEFDVYHPADLQSVLFDAFYQHATRLDAAFAKLPRMSLHLTA